MARWVGANIHGDRLRRLRGARMRSAVADAVAEGVGLIAQDAKDSIIEGAVSGPDHVPSAPGEPPNADTHELDQSIRVEMERSKLLGRVVVEAEYGAAQEFGTAELPERPYLRPAAKRQRPGARQLIAAAIRTVNRRG